MGTRCPDSVLWEWGLDHGALPLHPAAPVASECHVLPLTQCQGFAPLNTQLCGKQQETPLDGGELVVLGGLPRRPAVGPGMVHVGKRLPCSVAWDSSPRTLQAPVA